MTKKQIILYCLVIGIGLYIIPMFIYSSYIGNSITDNGEKWGQFGDFMGGALNPLLTIINIGVFVYLTFIVSESEKNRSKIEIKTQKQILLSQTRFQIVSELAKELDSATQKLVNIKKSYEEFPTTFNNLALIISAFDISYRELLPILKEQNMQTDMDSLIQSCIELGKILKLSPEEALKLLASGNPEFAQKEIRQFTKDRMIVVAKLNQYIVNNLSIEEEQ